MASFDVTYEIVTPESAEYGDAAERGFLVENVSLRDALEYFDSHGCMVEADCWPIQAPRWFDAIEDRLEDSVRRALHLPEDLSEYSRMRIAQLLEANNLHPQPVGDTLKQI